LLVACQTAMGQIIIIIAIIIIIFIKSCQNATYTKFNNSLYTTRVS